MPGSRGDLGFIANQRTNAPNRLFFGSPGHPSKKGVSGISQLSKMNVIDQDTNIVNVPQNITKPPEIASEQMISKRTEYLETQERRLTATINETKSETNRLNDTISTNTSTTMKAVEGLTNELQKTNAMVKTNSLHLYNEMQTVYGKVSGTLYGFSCEANNVQYSLAEYKKTPYKLNNISKTGTWVLLTYPMEPVIISDNHEQYFMKCKTVNKETGQLAIHWVLVFENKNKKENKFISEFSLMAAQ